TTQRRREFGGATCGQSSTDPLVPEQSSGANGAFSLCAEGSGIFLCAAKTRGPRARGTGQRGSGARSGQPTNTGNAGTGGGLQSVLFEPNLFARSRSYDSAVS